MMQKVIEKIGVWMLVICMLASQMTPVCAQNGYTAPTLCATEAEVEAGSTVEICIVMYNNPGIVSMQLDIGYDSSVLTLTKVTDGGLVGSQVHSDNLELCPYRLTWANDLETTNYSENGTIVTLTFEVADYAAPGEYSITVNYTKNNFEIFDCNANEVDFETVSGSVTVLGKIPAGDPEWDTGDVNHDGWVDAEDAALVMQYEVGLVDDDNLDVNAADVNEDGWIDAEDAALIMQFEVGIIDNFQ